MMDYRDWMFEMPFNLMLSQIMATITYSESLLRPSALQQSRDLSLSLTIPPGFSSILENLSREILREQPEDILAFAAIYFENKLNEKSEKGRGKWAQFVKNKPALVRMGKWYHMLRPCHLHCFDNIIKGGSRILKKGDPIEICCPPPPPRRKSKIKEINTIMC